jgi:3-oxoacyl-[acyl-carrier-protein] synthase-3
VPSSSTPSLVHARRRVALASLAGIGIYRPAPDAPLARHVSGAEVTGVSYRVAAGAGVTTASLAAGAARAALRAAGADATEVEMVLVGTSSPDVVWPSTACLVQTELKIPTVFAMDLYAAQASLLTALNVATRYVGAGSKCVLVIGADCDRQLVDLPGQASLVHARAAGAAILRPDDGGGGILAAGSGGAAHAGTNGMGQADHQDLAESVRDCLGKAGLNIADIDLVVADAAAPELMHAWAREEQLPSDRILLDAGRYGSLLAAAPFIVLHDAVRSGRLKSGMSVLILETGTGPVWSCACLQWGTTGVAEC